jgi:hypothetical protein
MWELNILEQSVRNWRCMPQRSFLIAYVIKRRKINFWLKRYTSHFVLAVFVTTKLCSSQYVYGAFTKQAGVQPSRM